MIIVRKVFTETRKKAVRIYCNYEIDGCVDVLWYEVSADFSDYISSECGDAFFVAFSLFAQLRGQDISFETAVSKRLYYGVTEVLFPALRVVSPQLPVISVIAKKKDFNFCPDAIGTALSLGVDSFHSVAKSLSGDFPVTHLTLFNSGAFGDFGGDASREIFLRTKECVELVADDIGLPLISVDSNISEMFQASFTRTHSIRNLSFALLFPRLFKIFYYASGYPAKDFKLDSSVVDPSYYDLLVSKALCTEGLEVMVAGLHDERINKLSFISDYTLSHTQLNVCILAESNRFLDKASSETNNCSRCFKCAKTMVALDALGVLDLYSRVFDIHLYKSERSRYLGRVLYDAIKLKNLHAIEIVKEAKKKQNFFPIAAYWYAFDNGLSNVWKKMQNKIKKGRGC